MREPRLCHPLGLPECLMRATGQPQDCPACVRQHDPDRPSRLRTLRLALMPYAQGGVLDLDRLCRDTGFVHESR